MKCLRLLNRRKHPCIISLLGSYTQRNEHYFLFPRFELDLNQFFSLEHATQKFEQLSTSLSALRGLASALCTLHELHLTSVEHGLEFEAIGYHHDLRPANILVGQETFVLADFGLGKLKPANEVSETAWKAGAGDYLAPECMNENFDHQNVGRSIDVWAFACLMAEVLVFTLQGRLGLIQFREARLHESPDSQWTNSYFYGQSGDSRPSVRQWLKVLQRHGCLQGCAQLILEALVKDPEKRPDMSRIHDHLSFFSLQAQHGLVCDNLTNVLSSMGPRTEYPPSAMKIWFERERLQAIGHALWLDNAGDIDSIPIIEETLHNHCLTKLTDIHERILRFNHECRTGTPSTRDPRMKNEVDTENSIISDLSASDMSSAHGLAGDLTELVQSIWCVLPSARLQMVEMQWVRRILESDDTQELGKVQRGLSFINPPRIYETSAALAMMKTVRLEILSNPLFDDYKNKLIANDVIFTGSFSGHETGLYERSTPVLLERMFYSPTWESVSSTQRAIVMSLKAKSFGYTPKPEGLRVLDCIGFYEEKGSNAGYVFTYRIPPQISQSPINPKPTTLSKLLLVSAKHAQKDPYCRQPLLEDKFHLAHILASFLMNFHGIGWLHENFHPKNIVFFKSPENNGSIDTSTSSIIREPYVVGLHKSRPGGESWHTEGPAQDLEAINYINPRYTQTKRFSVLDDYYSLGIMLLEIGLWYPSNVWSQKDESRRKLSPMALRDLFLKQYVPRLGPRMGSTYRSVVEICLTDGLDDGAIHATSEAKSQSIVNSFIEKVVYPLARLVIPSAGGKVTM
jgi:serine/threonine protein kinase